MNPRLSAYEAIIVMSVIPGLLMYFLDPYVSESLKPHNPWGSFFYQPIGVAIGCFFMSKKYRDSKL
jgi:hypothetical protein